MALKTVKISSALALVSALSQPGAAAAASPDPNATLDWRGAGWYVEWIGDQGGKFAEYGPFSSASACEPYRTVAVKKDRADQLDLLGEVRWQKTTADYPCVYEGRYVKFEHCFLTTACVRHAGLPDDCEELLVLRSFRDGYLARFPGGLAMIDEYYRVAPGIVRQIEGAPDRDAALAWILRNVRAAVGSIRVDRPMDALQRYCAMVQVLHRRYMAPREIPDVPSLIFDRRALGDAFSA